MLNQYRTGGKYQVHHLPWYNNSADLSKEEQYYIASCTKKTHWTDTAVVPE